MGIDTLRVQGGVQVTAVNSDGQNFLGTAVRRVLP